MALAGLADYIRAVDEHVKEEKGIISVTPQRVAPPQNTLLDGINKKYIAELKALATPPVVCHEIMSIVCAISNNTHKRCDWKACKAEMSEKDFMIKLKNVIVKCLKDKTKMMVVDFANSASCDPSDAGKKSAVCKIFCLWIRAIADQIPQAQPPKLVERIQVQE